MRHVIGGPPEPGRGRKDFLAYTSVVFWAFALASVAGGHLATGAILALIGFAIAMAS